MLQVLKFKILNNLDKYILLHVTELLLVLLNLRQIVVSKTERDYCKLYVLSYDFHCKCFRFTRFVELDKNYIRSSQVNVLL